MRVRIGVVVLLSGLLLRSLGAWGEEDRFVLWSTASLEGDTSVEVVWQPECLVLVGTSGGGAVWYGRTADDWYAQGTNLMLVAVPSNYYRFTGWQGQTNTGDNPLWLAVDSPWTNLSAVFAPQVTSNGTPLLWYVGWGITNDFEWHDAGDADGDGKAGWEEYVWGTDPTDDDSFPRVVISEREATGLQIVLPETATGRVYTVEQTVSLGEGGWRVLTNAEGVGGRVVFEIVPTNDRSFFRAKAVWP